MFDFRRTTLFCLDKRLSKHDTAIFSKNLGGHGPFGTPGFAYAFCFIRYACFLTWCVHVNTAIWSYQGRRNVSRARGQKKVEGKETYEKQKKSFPIIWPVPTRGVEGLVSLEKKFWPSLEECVGHSLKNLVLSL